MWEDMVDSGVLKSTSALFNGICTSLGPGAGHLEIYTIDGQPPAKLIDTDGVTYKYFDFKGYVGEIHCSQA